MNITCMLIDRIMYMHLRLRGQLLIKLYAIVWRNLKTIYSNHYIYKINQSYIMECAQCFIKGYIYRITYIYKEISWYIQK